MMKNSGEKEACEVANNLAAKPDGVTTNLARKIEGVQQTNPTEEDARVIRDFVKTAIRTKIKDAQAWKNLIKIIEQLREKSIHQEFKDLMTNLLTILDKVPEE